MEVLLIRHAESEWNARLSTDLDSDLSQMGKWQARRTGLWLTANFNFGNRKSELGRSFNWLISPYERTWQTMSILRQYVGIFQPLQPHDSLREYHVDKTVPPLPSGGMTLRKSKKFFPNEDIDQFFDRMRDFIKGLKQDQNYVLISHGAPVRTMCHLLTNKPLDEVRERYTTGLHESETTANCCLTWLVDGEEKWYNKTVY